MTHVTCRLTAKNRDPLPNCTLGSRVWAALFIIRKNFFTILTFNFLFIYDNVERFVSGFFLGGGRHHEGSGRSSSCDSPTDGAPHNTDAVVPDLIVKSRPD